MLYIEISDVLVWGEDDEYTFGHDGIRDIGRTLRLFSSQLEMVNDILERSEDLLRRGWKLFMRFIRTD